LEAFEPADGHANMRLCAKPVERHARVTPQHTNGTMHVRVGGDETPKTDRTKESLRLQEHPLPAPDAGIDDAAWALLSICNLFQFDQRGVHRPPVLHESRCNEHALNAGARTLADLGSWRRRWRRRRWLG